MILLACGRAGQITCEVPTVGSARTFLLWAVPGLCTILRTSQHRTPVKRLSRLFFSPRTLQENGAFLSTNLEIFRNLASD